jgi:biotin transport system substrate-specific component
METENKTFYEVLFQERTLLLDAFFILVIVAMLGVMANIRIPLWPVPVTMQTFGVFLVAFFFGSRKGFLSISAYVLAGLVGFGVFSGYKSGMAALIGPTGGYILGFLGAVFVVGYMIEKGFGRSKKSILLCMVVGNIVIYVFGLMVLKMYFAQYGLIKILSVGLIPFLVGDALKIFGAMALFPYLWRGAERIRQ